MAPRILLIDHESYKPPEEYRVLLSDINDAWAKRLMESPFMHAASTTEEEKAAAAKKAKENHDFMDKVFKRSGLSPFGTYLPPAIHPKFCGGKPKTDLDSAMVEAQEAMAGALEGLLKKTGLRVEDIDILVTTCSIFCPTPSLSSMLINHFKMRKDIKAYHLGGMGCSNGVVAINLVRDLLKVTPNANAVFVTHEATTPAFYGGSDRSRLVTNVLFRMGASAMLLSNKSSWAPVAKYKLTRCVRMHTGARDEAYRCIWYGPDEEGHVGVALKMTVVDEASRALTLALRRIAPHVMTWSQIVGYLRVEAQRFLATKASKPVPPSYQPGFGEGVQHFLLHAGGAKVLDGLGKSLQLTADHLEPSRAVLHDYGNVSSSTTWYTLGYVESVRGVKAGDKVMQVGVGSGVKVGVNVWQALRDVDDLHQAWESRITPERKAQLDLARPRRTWMLTLLRVLVFLLVLALLAACTPELTRLLHRPPAAAHNTEL